MTPKASKTDDGGQPAVMMTARQLVATVCVLLLLGGALMTAGIWVGMRQAARTDAETPTDPPDSPVADIRERGQQTSPLDFSTLTPPAAQDDAPYTDVVPPAADPEDLTAESGDNTPPDDLDLPALAAEDPPRHADLPAGTDGTGGEAPERDTDDEPDVLEPPEPVEIADHEESGHEDDPSPTPQTMYSIQVAAFRAAERDKAASFADDHADLDPELVTSPDGEWVRVLVGRYTTRAEASARQEELSERPGFEDCWVQVRQP